MQIIFLGDRKVRIGGIDRRLSPKPYKLLELICGGITHRPMLCERLGYSRDARGLRTLAKLKRVLNLQLRGTGVTVVFSSPSRYVPEDPDRDDDPDESES